MADHVSPRVNSARLPDYMHKTVRLTGKQRRMLDDVNGDFIVSASDGGEVRIRPPAGTRELPSDYLEVIGNVTANDAIKAHAIIDLGKELDLDIVNFVVEKWHDPKFENVV